MPPRRYVLDTNIYRYTASAPGFGDRISEDFHSIRVSAVVLSELRRSAQSEAAQVRVELMEHKMSSFTFAPTHRDWFEVGRYLSTRLSRAGKKPTAETLHAIRKEQNDALIALSSWNKGFAVVTCDNDFEHIRTWAKASEWQLVRIDAPTSP